MADARRAKIACDQRLHKSFEFSTRHVPQHQRAEWFSNQFSTTFFPMRAGAVDGQAFSIDMTIHGVRDINISFNTVTAHRAPSTRAQTSNAGDIVLLAFKLSGKPHSVSYDGTTTPSRRGKSCCSGPTGR